MKQRVSLFLLITILAGLLAACGSAAPTGGGATTAPSGGGAATTETGGGATTAPEATTAATTTGGEAATTAATTTGGATAGGGEIIRIYSSFPRQGASKGQTDAAVNAIKMRLEEDNYQACNGQFKIDYQDLDDATAAKGSWDEATETANAN